MGELPRRRAMPRRPWPLTSSFKAQGKAQAEPLPVAGGAGAAPRASAHAAAAARVLTGRLRPTFARGSVPVWGAGRFRVTSWEVLIEKKNAFQKFAFKLVFLSSSSRASNLETAFKFTESVKPAFLESESLHQKQGSLLLCLFPPSRGPAALIHLS